MLEFLFYKYSKYTLGYLLVLLCIFLLCRCHCYIYIFAIFAFLFICTRDFFVNNFGSRKRYGHF